MTFNDNMLLFMMILTITPLDSAIIERHSVLDRWCHIQRRTWCSEQGDTC